MYGMYVVGIGPRILLTGSLKWAVTRLHVWFHDVMVQDMPTSIVNNRSESTGEYLSIQCTWYQLQQDAPVPNGVFYSCTELTDRVCNTDLSLQLKKAPVGAEMPC